MPARPFDHHEVDLGQALDKDAGIVLTAHGIDQVQRTGCGVSGQQATAAVDDIRAYWRARGATFVLHRPGGGAGTVDLDRVLESADIVFLATDCIDRETERRIEARCDRLERPMIVLYEGSLWAVEQALRMWYPLARL